MLILPDLAPERPDARPVGVGCRVCARQDCTARREPSILSGIEA
jgi:predicted transcriptional regulator